MAHEDIVEAHSKSGVALDASFWTNDKKKVLISFHPVEHSFL